MSLPSRECGLKLTTDNGIHFPMSVTPLAGVWIEIHRGMYLLGMAWSLPSRECGLKFRRSLPLLCSLLSLPSRECGLKSPICRHHRLYHLSLPSRECGLKFHPLGGRRQDVVVTPLAGVWIEIFVHAMPDISGFVTPLAGVWIEIL